MYYYRMCNIFLISWEKSIDAEVLVCPLRLLYSLLYAVQSITNCVTHWHNCLWSSPWLQNTSRPAQLQISIHGSYPLPMSLLETLRGQLGSKSVHVQSTQSHLFDKGMVLEACSKITQPTVHLLILLQWNRFGFVVFVLDKCIVLSYE